MSAKLYIGNLDYSVTDDDLQTLFASVGTVRSAQVIIDRDSRRSKGFGFVEMSSEQEAQQAISELNDKDLNGRAISVSEARPPESRPPRSSGSSGGNFRRGQQRDSRSQDNRGGGRRY